MSLLIRSVLIAAMVSACGYLPAMPPVAGDDDGTNQPPDDEQPESPIPGLATAWAIHDGEKIERDDLSHPGKTGNAAWRAGVAHVFGGHNEIVAFQVIVEADAAGIGALDVRLPKLAQRGGNG